MKSSTDAFGAHINAIILKLTQTVYQTVSWALFAQHQLIFSFSLCANILKTVNYDSAAGGGIVDESLSSIELIGTREYNFFLNSSLLADMQLDALSTKLKSYADRLLLVRDRLLLDEKVLRQLLLLEDILPDKFAAILHNILTNFISFWSRLLAEPDPYMFMHNKGTLNYDWLIFHFCILKLIFTVY